MKIALECLECGKKFKRARPNGCTECPKCGSTDIDLDYYAVNAQERARKMKVSRILAERAQSRLS